jgi:type IV pilus assembly protein PilE
MVKTSMLPATSRQGFTRGFTLIELMVAIAVLGILLAIAVPSYTKYIRESRRAQAQSEMLEMRIGMESWRANKASYRSDADAGSAGTATSNTAANAGFTGTNDYYTYTIPIAAGAANDNTYTITATAVAGTSQASDVTGSGTSCTPLTLDQNGAKGTNAACWKK